MKFIKVMVLCMLSCVASYLVTTYLIGGFNISWDWWTRYLSVLDVLAIMMAYFRIAEEVRKTRGN